MEVKFKVPWTCIIGGQNLTSLLSKLKFLFIALMKGSQVSVAAGSSPEA